MIPRISVPSLFCTPKSFKLEIKIPKFAGKQNPLKFWYILIDWFRSGKLTVISPNSAQTILWTFLTPEFSNPPVTLRSCLFLLFKSLQQGVSVPHSSWSRCRVYSVVKLEQCHWTVKTHVALIRPNKNNFLLMVLWLHIS